MTIQEIAEALGISKSTVSRALSGKGRISEETRQRIQDYINQNREDGGADDQNQEPRQQLTHCIAVVMPADVYVSGTPFFQNCLLGISEAASMLQYDVLIVAGMMHDISGVQSLVEKHKVDGVLLMRGVDEDRVLRYLVEMGIPTGLVGSCNYKEVIQVDIDQKSASEAMMIHLLGLGYRRFATIVGNTTYGVNRKRYGGLMESMEKMGITREHNILFSNYTQMELVDGVVEKILANKTECIICGDDEICTSVMSNLQSKGYRIPRDISIVSLHSSTNLECFSPSVTAVNVSAKRLGNLVTRQLIHCLQGKEYEEKTVLDCEILFRKSTRKMN